MKSFRSMMTEQYAQKNEQKINKFASSSSTNISALLTLVSTISKTTTTTEKSEEKSDTAPDTLYIIATGGTIAGTSKSSTSSNYESGKLSAKDLTDAIPDLKQFKKIETLDLFHIDSSDITTEHWLTLANKTNDLLKKSDVKGVVITHGTDTLEETAYFLDLVIKSKKPVVLVGSMRPSTSLSSDGPLNLYNALAVANASESAGKGVLVVMNDSIFDARDVTKQGTTQVNVFSSPNTGKIGSVNYGEVTFCKNVTRKNTIDTPFDVSELTELPNVEIIYEFAGSSGKLLEAAIKHIKPQGIVIAGTGNGNITLRDKELMKQAREDGIQIIRSSRTGSGQVTYDYVDQLDSKIGLIAGDDLNPQKARILLMLSLTQTKNEKEIRQNFKMF